jgi:hypothetical protein
MNVKLVTDVVSIRMTFVLISEGFIILVVFYLKILSSYLNFYVFVAVYVTCNQDIKCLCIRLLGLVILVPFNRIFPIKLLVK